MKKLMILLLAVLSVVMLAGCGGGGGGSDSPKVTKVTISGQVITADGSYCKGFKAALYNLTDADPLDVITTNSLGEFSFPNLEPGYYKVIAYNDGFKMFSNTSVYTLYDGTVPEVIEDVTVIPFRMNKSAVKKTFTYASGDAVSVWTPDNSLAPKTKDGRKIITVFFDKTMTKGDSEHFNNFVKFEDGSISKVEGVVSGGAWRINKEIPVCNADLSDFTCGNYSVISGDTDTFFVKGFGTFVGSPMVVTSSDPMFNTSVYLISPDLGWISEYNTDGDTFVLSSID